MTVLVVLAALVVILLAYGWHLTWLASRLDRAHRRVERSWAVLDAALTHRAGLTVGGADPAGLNDAQQQVMVARRIHNDAVAVAQALRRRRTVIVFRLAGHAAEPTSFEMVDGPVRTNDSEARVAA